MVPVVALVGIGLFERGFPVVKDLTSTISLLSHHVVNTDNLLLSFRIIYLMSQIATCAEIGLPMLVLFVALSQYLKHVQMCHFPIFERFSVLISIALVWLYAQILTVSGAYKHSPVLTQLNCRTDRANLITTAPWSVD